jgi:hypothetical protein
VKGRLKLNAEPEVQQVPAMKITVVIFSGMMGGAVI